MNEEVRAFCDDFLKQNPNASDELYVTNVWFELTNTRYDMHKFLFNYVDGIIPREYELLAYRREVTKKD